MSMQRLVHSVRVIAPLLLLGAFAVSALFWAQGYRVYAVRTGSMAPTYPAGSVVIDAPVAGQALAVGDVVTFRTAGGLVTHRLHGRTATGWLTKGDANRTPDPWTVPARNIVGHVAAGVPRGGYALIYLAQPTGVLSLVLLALSMWCSWSLFFPDREDEPDAICPAGADAWPVVHASGSPSAAVQASGDSAPHQSSRSSRLLAASPKARPG